MTKKYVPVNICTYKACDSSVNGFCESDVYSHRTFACKWNEKENPYKDEEIVGDTPRTDKAFIGDTSVGLLPEIKGWAGATRFARQLERELAAVTKERDLALEWCRKKEKIETHEEEWRDDNERLAKERDEARAALRLILPFLSGHSRYEEFCKAAGMEG